MKVVALIVVVLLCGCAGVRIESLSLLQGQISAVASRERGQVGEEVSVVGLPEILARATWVDSRVYHKGGIWLRFAGGREVFLPYGFEFFIVGGVRGRFEIRKEDIERYRDIAQRIQKENSFRSEVRPNGSADDGK